MNDLLFTQGKDNLAGIVGEVYVCPSEDIATLPALAAASSLLTAAAANITCKTGKRFFRVYFTDETAKVETTSVGERDGKGRETMLTGRYPALGTELEDFIRAFQNTPAVVIYRLARNGKLYMMGVSQLDQASTALSLDIAAYFESGEAASGEARADQNGALISWKYSAAHGPIQYQGAVPLTPAP